MSVSCQNELPVTLNESIQYREDFNICSKLKSGVSGVLIDYEHIRFVGLVLWKLLHDLHQVFFDKNSVCKTLKMGLVLPLFEGKRARANNKDNYRGITLFPTLCKIYEISIMPVLCEAEHKHKGFQADQKLCNVSSNTTIGAKFEMWGITDRLSTF